VEYFVRHEYYSFKIENDLCNVSVTPFTVREFMLNAFDPQVVKALPGIEERRMRRIEFS